MSRRRRRRAVVTVAVWATSVSVAVLAVCGSAAARVRATRSAAGGSTTAISTNQFVNQFDTEPYVGNGYFSQRIPSAGMGLLTGLGTIG
jgi:hypothetical protein